MHPAIPISLLFIGCCSNVIFLELLVSQVPGCGSLVTMCQFLFITLEGFIFTTKFGTKKPVIPISYYLYMVGMFFVVQVVNNIVFNFNIAMPLHMIFRSGTLAATMILGIFILKRQYKLSKYISVALITLGIIICTISSANQMEFQPSKTGNLANDYFMWLIGIALLVFALFTSSLMGIFQEKTYKQFGKHPKEALFYNHALPLPMFLILSNNIYSSYLSFNQSEPYTIPVLGSIPTLWLYLIGYCLTQYPFTTTVSLSLRNYNQYFLLWRFMKTHSSRISYFAPQIDIFQFLLQFLPVQVKVKWKIKYKKIVIIVIFSSLDPKLTDILTKDSYN